MNDTSTQTKPVMIMRIKRKAPIRINHTPKSSTKGEREERPPCPFQNASPIGAELPIQRKRRKVPCMGVGQVEEEEEMPPCNTHLAVHAMAALSLAFQVVVCMIFSSWVKEKNQELMATIAVYLSSIVTTATIGMSSTVQYMNVNDAVRGVELIAYMIVVMAIATCILGAALSLNLASLLATCLTILVAFPPHSTTPSA
jgi:hypothetical protein